MLIRVKLFAAARQLVGTESIRVEVAGRPTVAALRAALMEQFPPLAQLLKHTLIAVNADYAGGQQEIGADDEVACIPPVSGG